MQDSLSALAANDASTGSGVSQRFTYAELAVYDAKSQQVTQPFGSCSSWSALLGSDLATAKFSYYPLVLQLSSAYSTKQHDYDMSHALQTDVFCRNADKVAEIVDALTATSITPRFGDNALQRRSKEQFLPSAQRLAPHVFGSGDQSGGDAAIIGAPLDRRFTFDSFLVGESNRLAHAAAMRIASAGANESALYNPLYLHAAVGLGKTHLIQAIANAAALNGQRSLYLTAEKFMYGFVSALRAHTAVAYKERLRSIDKLIIDDVQFLRGKSIPQEFCHTLNALIDAGKQVVIAADRPPSELDSLDDRVRSRLSGGLCVEMRPFDEALRVSVIEARIEAARATQPGFEVPAAVVRYVATVIQTNGRDLDGAVNRLLAHATLASTPLTIELAEVAIRDLVRLREPKRVKIEDIQKLVANHYSVSRPDILSSRRTATVVRPRQIAMYLAKVLTLRSLPEIGRRFGGRDHTTVLHAVRKIETLAKTDGVLSEELELLKRMLTDQ